MSSEDSRLTPDPRSSAIGDLTNSLRSHVDDVRSWVSDFGQRIETHEILSLFSVATAPRRSVTYDGGIDIQEMSGNVADIVDRYVQDESTGRVNGIAYLNISADGSWTLSGGE